MMRRVLRAAVVTASALVLSGAVSVPLQASAAPLPPGGVAWTESHLAPGTQMLPYAGVVQFRDRSMWVGGSDLAGQPSKFTPKLVSGNGGDGWSEVPMAPLPPTANVQAESIDGLSRTSAVVVGDSSAQLGGFLAERLEGGSWHLDTVPAPADILNGALLSVKELAPDDIWAVGFAVIDLKIQDDDGFDLVRWDAIIRHWDGTAWRVVPVPDTVKDSALFSLTVSGGRMWAVGRTFLGDGTARPVMVEFDGRSWKQTALPPMPSNMSELRAVAARSSRDVWAVGGYRDDAGNSHGLTLHYDGRSWQTGPALPAASDEVLDSVAATDRGIVAFGNRSDTDAAFGVQFAAGAWSPVYLPDGQKEGVFTARRLNVTDGRIALTGTRWAGDHIEGVVLTGRI
ncbi:MAG: hypothetical protein HOU01_07430 [Streptomycetaceae bacterium]|nr:hypothetical protein [Streptomycetaceae bacterium]